MTRRSFSTGNWPSSRATRRRRCWPRRRGRYGRAGELRLRMSPGQGVAQSLRSGITVMTRVMMLAGVLLGLAVSAAMLIAGRTIIVDAAPWMVWLLIYLGLGFALAFGLLAYLQHARLRRVLHDRGHIAEEYPAFLNQTAERNLCLLYTSPSPRDRTRSRMPSSA